MSTSTIILIQIGAIIWPTVILGFIMSKQMYIKKNAIINKPKQLVFEYVKRVKNQDNFSVWNLKER